MKFIKVIQIKKKFKKCRIVPSGEMPDAQDRDEFLVNYSVNNDIPILIGAQKRWDDLKYINPNVELYRFANNFTIEVRDKEFPNGVLVDETITIDMIGWLKEKSIKISGGFS